MISPLLLIKMQEIQVYRKYPSICLIRRKQYLINWKLEVENIRKKSLKAYILLESMVAMTLLIFLVTFVLDQVIQVKKQTHEENRKIEALNVALMAVDIGEERLKINDVEVFIEESTSKIVVWESGKVLITLEKKKTF